MKIELSDETAKRLEEITERHGFSSAEDVISAALSLMDAERAASNDAAKIALLNARWAEYERTGEAIDHEEVAAWIEKRIAGSTD